MGRTNDLVFSFAHIARQCWDLLSPSLELADVLSGDKGYGNKDCFGFRGLPVHDLVPNLRRLLRHGERVLSGCRGKQAARLLLGIHCVRRTIHPDDKQIFPLRLSGGKIRSDGGGIIDGEHRIYLRKGR